MQERQRVFAQRLKEFTPATWEQIPDLGLYMDQVITYVERQLAPLYREGERPLTPSIVNNYVKMGLVNRPVGKKYGREQLAQLLMLCVLKQAASAEGLKQLTRMPGERTIEALYGEFCGQLQEVLGELAAALPLPSVMYCAVHSAAYSFLCGALLAREEAPKEGNGKKPAGREEATKTEVEVPPEEESESRASWEQGPQ